MNAITERIMLMNGFKELKNSISESATKEVVKVYEMCVEKKWSFGNLKPLLLRMVEHDVESDWCVRITKSKELFKNDSASLASFENRFGKKGKELYEEKLEKCSLNKWRYVKKHGKDAWVKLCVSKASIDEASFNERYGEEEGNKKRQEYLKKWTKSVKEKGGWNNGLSLESFVEKHGKEDGYKRWNNRRINQRKRFSREWFQNEHGDMWKEEWEKYCQHMTELSKKGAGENCFSYSKKSQKLFWKILVAPGFSSAKFHENGGEEVFSVNETWARYFRTDFLFEKKVIEFDGTYWHSKERAQFKDPKIDNHLKEHGYQILRITEKEYDENPIKAADKCIAYLMEGK